MLKIQTKIVDFCVPIFSLQTFVALNSSSGDKQSKHITHKQCWVYWKKAAEKKIEIYWQPPQDKAPKYGKNACMLSRKVCTECEELGGDDVQLVLFARLGKEKRSSHFSLLLAVKPDRAIIYFRFKKVFVVSSVMLMPTSVRSFICPEGCQTFDTYGGYMFPLNVCLFVFFFKYEKARAW